MHPDIGPEFYASWRGDDGLTYIETARVEGPDLAEFFGGEHSDDEWSALDTALLKFARSLVDVKVIHGDMMYDTIRRTVLFVDCSEADFTRRKNSKDVRNLKFKLKYHMRSPERLPETWKYLSRFRC